MKSKQTKELHIVSLSSRMFCLRINEGARIFCNNVKKISRPFPLKMGKADESTAADKCIQLSVSECSP